jgi:hypothetical protein
MSTGFDNWQKSGAEAWLLANDGIALPTLGDSPQWKGPGVTGSFGGTKTADFAFKRTVRMGELYAVVLKIGESTYILKIPPTTQELSAGAQFIFDMLTSYSTQDLEAFEAGHLNETKPSEQELRVGIENAKNQLMQLGINVKWDTAKESYQLSH